MATKTCIFLQPQAPMCRLRDEFSFSALEVYLKPSAGGMSISTLLVT